MSEPDLTKEQAEAARKSAAKATSFVKKLEHLKDPTRWGKPCLMVTNLANRGFIHGHDGSPKPVVRTGAEESAGVIQAYDSFGDMIRDGWKPSFTMNIFRDLSGSFNDLEASTIAARDLYRRSAIYPQPQPRELGIFQNGTTFSWNSNWQ